MIRLGDIPPASAEVLAEYKDWAVTLPECIRDLALRFRPNVVYRMKRTLQPCVIYSISEDRTVMVTVFDRIMFDATGVIEPTHHVFGVDPDDLDVLYEPRAN